MLFLFMTVLILPVVFVLMPLMVFQKVMDRKLSCLEGCFGIVAWIIVAIFLLSIF